MSSADDREQSEPRFTVVEIAGPRSPIATTMAIRAVVVGVLAMVACGRGPEVPAGCEPLARALRSASSGGRDLIAEVDAALEAARDACRDRKQAIHGAGVAQQLARARLAEPHREAALAELKSVADPAVALRRAELLDGLGEPVDALAALSPALADPSAQVRQRILQVSIAARAGTVAEVERVIRTAPLPERITLAHRAAADAPISVRDSLARGDTPELVAAIADVIEQQHGPAAARTARERLVVLEPDNADHWDALGRARIAAGMTSDALAAWDRAHEIAPAQPAFVLTPIDALLIANERGLATTRVASVAARARSRHDIPALETASAAAAKVGDSTLALALAREAHALRPTDGKLAFLVGQRLTDAGDRSGAANAYAELLVCGAHGRPWHRHEVAAKLVALGDPATVATALSAKRACSPVDAEDLERYLATLRPPR